MGDQVTVSILPRDIIFSCSICHATVSEIYSSANLGQGLDNGSNGEVPQPVTRLWLTECSHVVCSKHFEGGGVPFHRADERPRAICPICATENNNTDKRELYAIRGFEKGQYDPIIPSEWLQSPPVTLDRKGNSKGMEALTFHYLALVKFGVSAAKERLKTKAMLKSLEGQASEGKMTQASLNKEIEGLRSKIADLEQCEKDLKPWKDRVPKIKFYLDLFPKIIKENERLREQLTAMGYAVPKRTYSVNPDFGEGEQNTTQVGNQSNEQAPNQSPSHRITLDTNLQLERRTQNVRNENFPTDHSASESIDAADYRRIEQADHTARVSKRPREENQSRGSDQLENQSHRVRSDSRHLMPPPPLPFHKEPQTLRPHKGQDDSDIHNQAYYMTRSAPFADPQTHEDLRLDEGAHFGHLPVRRTDGSDLSFNNGSIYITSQQGLHKNNPGGEPFFYPPGLDRFEEAENARSNHDPRRQREMPNQVMGHHQQDSQRPLNTTNEFCRDRPPLQEQDGNLQRFRYGTPAGTVDDYVDSIHTYRSGQNSWQQAATNSHQEPRTPSPLKHSASRNLGTTLGPQSVISPFFKRQSGMKHTGRMTMSKTPLTRPLPPSSSSQFPLEQRQFLTPHRLSRTGTATSARLIYPQSTPARHSHAQTQPPREQLLVSNTARTSNGLFQRPDLPSRPTFQPPASPYFGSRTRSYIPEAQLASAMPRSSLAAHSIPNLGSTTPSLRSNMYIHRDQVSPNRLAAPNSTPIPRRSEFTDYDLAYAHGPMPRDEHRYEHTLTGTGLRSGVSRPSNEMTRVIAGPSRGLQSGRRSIRR